MGAHRLISAPLIALLAQYFVAPLLSVHVMVCNVGRLCGCGSVCDFCVRDLVVQGLQCDGSTAWVVGWTSRSTGCACPSLLSMRLRVLNEFRSAPTCLAGPVFSQYYSYAQMQLAGCNPPNLCDCVVVICVSPCELSLAKSL